ncbi:MAG: divergent PAP2 family protein [Candidatus Omnitrophica bacterium]|nr:divergent PAP2 family protein [Candidatus Omnitrophota bacterium]
MQIQDTDFFRDVAANRLIMAAVSSWIGAQLIKVFLGLVKEHRFNFRWILTTGGMPSAHSAGVAALATAAGLYTGFDSVPFAIAAVFALITMFDAQGIRRMAGQQAEVLNRIVEDIYQHRGVNEERLKELLGHTPVEVLAGAALGMVIAVLVVSLR